MIMITINDVCIQDKFKHSLWKSNMADLKNKFATLLSFGTAFFLLYLGFLIILYWLKPKEYNVSFYIALIIFFVIMLIFIIKLSHCYFQMKRANEERKFVHFLRMNKIYDCSFFYQYGILYFQIVVNNDGILIKKKISVKNSLSIQPSKKILYIKN